MTVSGAVRASAPAKINLRLGVGPLRPDGFHPLGTVYLALDWRDHVTARPADDWSVEVATSVPGRVALDQVPTTGDNLALRAARLLADQAGVSDPVAVRIDKQIPVAGGLAGGSADAAAALVACDRLWRLGTSPADLLALAAELGSDVPFALVGGAALGVGRGERVTPLPVGGRLWWVVLPDAAGLSTPAVYAEYDRLVVEGAIRPVGVDVPTGLPAALASGDPHALSAYLVNDLAAPATSLRPELADRLATGAAAGALAPLLSGSGPTCLFLCDSRRRADAVVRALATRGLPGALVSSGPTPGAVGSVEELPA